MDYECTYKDARQEVWQIGDRKISIVDLRRPEKNGPISDIMARVYKSHPYEVADVTDGIEALGRFKTDEDALKFARGYVEEEIYLLREEPDGRQSSGDKDQN